MTRIVSGDVEFILGEEEVSEIASEEGVASPHMRQNKEVENEQKSSGVQIIERDASSRSEFEELFPSRVLSELERLVLRRDVEFSVDELTSDERMLFGLPSTDKRMDKSFVYLTENGFDFELFLPPRMNESEAEELVNRVFSMPLIVRMLPMQGAGSKVPDVYPSQPLSESRARQFGKSLVELCKQLSTEVPDRYESANANLKVTWDDLLGREDQFVEFKEYGDVVERGVIVDIRTVGDSIAIQFERGDDFFFHTEDDMDEGPLEAYVDTDYDAQMARHELGLIDSPFKEVIDWPENYAQASEKDVLDLFEDVVGCIKDDKVREFAINNLSKIRDRETRAHFNPSSGTIALSNNPDHDTVMHESAHLIADAFDYDTDDIGNVLSTLYTRGCSEDMDIGAYNYDVIDDFAQRKRNKRGPAMSISRGAKMKQYVSNKSMIKHDFKFTQNVFSSKNPPEELEELIEECNRAWERTIDKMPQERADVAPIQEYAVMNANETFAIVHEALQSNVPGISEYKDMFIHHPELLKAYFKVFEPPKRNKKVLNDAYEWADGMTLVREFDSMPFPEVGT